MTILFHIFDKDDVYEVALCGTVVQRITRYLNGSSLREDFEFGEVPVNVQQDIIKRARELLESERSEE